MPGPKPHRAVISPSGIRYKRATSVVSSASRKVKKIAVMEAITMAESKYCQKTERKDELRMGAEFIIPLHESGLDPFRPPPSTSADSFSIWVSRSALRCAVLIWIDALAVAMLN